MGLEVMCYCVIRVTGNAPGIVPGAGYWLFPAENAWGCLGPKVHLTPTVERSERR